MNSSIPESHDVARRAQLAVEHELQPCVVTRLGQGEDYGLDGYVQHVLPGQPLLRTSIGFAIQVKGTGAAFDGVWREHLRTAHLKGWEQESVEVLVAVHSTKSKTTRWRFAHDIVRKLDAQRDGWRKQETVSVEFSERDERSGSELHAWLHVMLQDLTDREGGRLKIHRRVRRVLLTELYHDYAYVGQRGGLAETPGGPAVAHFVTGTQWKQGEVDERTVLASRVLTGALLLYEQIYFPTQYTYAAIGALGPDVFIRLLEAERLIPVALQAREFAFVTGSAGRGDLYFLHFDAEAVQIRELRSLQSKYNLSDDVVGRTLAATRRTTLQQKMESELLEVTKAAYVRDLLGLGKPRPQSEEPPWAAERLLRIGHVVKYYGVGEQLSVDVVEMERGLARLALARWGSRISFHRVYQSLVELESVLRAAALPDLQHVSQ